MYLKLRKYCNFGAKIPAQEIFNEKIFFSSSRLTFICGSISFRLVPPNDTSIGPYTPDSINRANIFLVDFYNAVIEKQTAQTAVSFLNSLISRE